MQGKTKGLLIILLTTLFITVAQLLLKQGIDAFPHPFAPVPSLWYLIGGLALYGVSALLLIVALRFGELSVLYPVYATSYLWVALLSFLLLGEAMPWNKLIGILAIMGGIVVLMGGSA